jgi:hypothetical protein
MNCPVCREPLLVAERQGIELDCCPWCRGLWFDAAELALLAEATGKTLTLLAGARLAPATSEKPRPCPRCDRPMEKILLGRTPEVLLDRCSGGHGLWFDHGELGALVRQLASAPGSHPDAVLAFMGETLGAATAAAAAENEIR